MIAAALLLAAGPTSIGAGLPRPGVVTTVSVGEPVYESLRSPSAMFTGADGRRWPRAMMIGTGK